MATVLQRSPGHIVQLTQSGLWQITFHYPASTNCWLWQELDGLTLIDAGHPWNTRVILEATEIIGVPLRRVILTHAHPDHAGAAAELARITGALVFAHETEVGYLQGRGSMADEQGSRLCRTVLGAGQCLGILNPPVVEHVEPLVEGQQIGSLRVLHTPGHTPGSISLWAEKEKAIFCGDNVCASSSMLHIGLPWFTLDVAMQRTSVYRYAELPAQLLLSGHGPVYRGDVASSVKQLLDRSRSRMDRGAPPLT